MIRQIIILGVIVSLCLSGCKRKVCEEAVVVEVDNIETLVEIVEKEQLIQENEEANINNKDVKTDGTMKQIIDNCLDKYTCMEEEKDGWLIYRCIPNEDCEWGSLGDLEIKAKYNFTNEVYDYETAKNIMKEFVDYDEFRHELYDDNPYKISQFFSAFKTDENENVLIRVYLFYQEGYAHLLYMETTDLPLANMFFSLAKNYTSESKSYEKEKMICGDNKEALFISEISKYKRYYEFYYNESEEMLWNGELDYTDNEYKLVVNHADRTILDLEWEMSPDIFVFEVQDINCDGYGDILIMVKGEGESADQNHDLYLWNIENECFDKVQYSGKYFLATVEINDDDEIINRIYLEGRYILEKLELRNNELVAIASEVEEEE